MPKNFGKTKELLLGEFAQEFLSLRPCSHRKYNRMRNPEHPAWETLARMFGVETWNELLEVAGLGLYRKACKEPHRFTIKSHDDIGDGIVLVTTYRQGEL